MGRQKREVRVLRRGRGKPVWYEGEGRQGGEERDTDREEDSGVRRGWKAAGRTERQL